MHDELGHLIGPGLFQRPAIAIASRLEFGVSFRRVAEHHDALATETEKMSGRLVAARFIVTAKGDAGLTVDVHPVNDEAGVGGRERIQFLAILDVIAIAEKDQAIGPPAGLVFDMPVVGQLLQRDQDVVAEARCGAGDVAEHRKEKRVDLCVLATGLVEDEQRDRVALMRAQSRRVTVDEVVEFAGDLLDALARFLAHQRTVAQRPRHGSLRDPGDFGDIARCGVFELHGAIVEEGAVPAATTGRKKRGDEHLMNLPATARLRSSTHSRCVADERSCPAGWRYWWYQREIRAGQSFASGLP